MKAFGSNHGHNCLHSSLVEGPQAEQQGNLQQPPQRDRSSTPTVTGNIVMNDGYAYPVFQSSSPPAVTPPPMAPSPGWHRLPAAPTAHENMMRPPNYPQVPETMFYSSPGPMPQPRFQHVATAAQSSPLPQSSMYDSTRPNIAVRLQTDASHHATLVVDNSHPSSTTPTSHRFHNNVVWLPQTPWEPGRSSPTLGFPPERVQATRQRIEFGSSSPRIPPSPVRPSQPVRKVQPPKRTPMTGHKDLLGSSSPQVPPSSDSIRPPKRQCATRKANALPSSSPALPSSPPLPVHSTVHAAPVGGNIKAIAKNIGPSAARTSSLLHTSELNTQTCSDPDGIDWDAWVDFKSSASESPSSRSPEKKAPRTPVYRQDYKNGSFKPSVDPRSLESIRKLEAREKQMSTPIARDSPLTPYDHIVALVDKERVPTLMRDGFNPVQTCHNTVGQWDCRQAGRPLWGRGGAFLGFRP